MKTRHPKAKAQTQAPAKEEKHSHRNWKKKKTQNNIIAWQIKKQEKKYEDAKQKNVASEEEIYKARENNSIRLGDV